MSSPKMVKHFVAAVILVVCRMSEARADIIQQAIAVDYLIVEAEDYDILEGGLSEDGFLVVTTAEPFETSIGSQVLPEHSNASGGAALFDQQGGAWGSSTATWKLEFATPGVYNLYVHYSMFELGGRMRYTNEDSFFFALDFNQRPDYARGLNKRGHNDSFEDPPFWEGNFHWQKTRGAQYVVRDTDVGITLDVHIATREGGSTLDMLVFHRNPDLNELDLDKFLQTPNLIQLLTGDADQDLDFDPIDIIKVLIANKYRSGQPATWGEGDWNGAPGGSPGNPPPGDGLFNQLDIISALLGGTYLTGPYAAITAGGTENDSQTSIVYNANSGELSVDSPSGADLTSINIDSASGVFTADPALNLGGSFDNDADDNIFKATFGSSFGSLSFGDVAQTGLSEEFILNDLSVVGSLAGGGDLGNVDLIYVPEPAAWGLAAFGVVLLIIRKRETGHGRRETGGRNG